MKPKILVSREVFDEVLDYLAPHFEIEANQEDVPLDPATLATRLADCEGAIVALTDRIDSALLDRCPKLKAICNIAVGYNNIDVAACTAHGVMATNTPGVLDDATADFTWTLILATARRLTEAEAYLRNGEWKGWHLKQLLGIDVCRATLGIFGMGRIGQAVARRAAGFEMKVLYSNRTRLDDVMERNCGARYAAKEEILENADIIALHLPYSPATHHFIGEAELARMKPTSILINVARGGVVDDEALIRALRSGQILGAGLDVFENEPKLNPGFLELKNVVLAPHIASSTRATRMAMAMTAARNLVAALKTGNPPNLINPDVRSKSQ
jgi:gluconate 2-dehydrogenase